VVMRLHFSPKPPVPAYFRYAGIVHHRDFCLDRSKDLVPEPSERYPLDQESLHFKTSASAVDCAKFGLWVNDRAAVEPHASEKHEQLKLRQRGRKCADVRNCFNRD
jgi:hypothetical protein